MEWKQYIISDKKILLGKPTIKGTRISIEFIVNLLANGWSEKQILENYPNLNKKHLQAVFSYIHEVIKDNVIYNDTLETI